MLASHKFTWSFLHASVSFPIISIDFLIHQGLLLEAARGHISASSSGTCIPLSRQSSCPTAAILLPELPAASVHATAPAAAAAAAPSSTSAASTIPTSFQAILAQFPEVINPSKRLPQTCHGIKHHLLPLSGDSTPRSWPPQRRSSRPWNMTASCAAPTAPGPHRFT